MAAKAKNVTQSNEVAISRVALEQFVSVIEGLEQADRTYQPCQSTLFRNFAQGAYKANKTLDAMNAAKAALEE